MGMRWASKVDAKHAAIAKELKQAGCSVAHLFRRNSDEAYASMAYCVGETESACFVAFKLPHVMCKVMHWLTPSGMKEHFSNPKVFDTITPHLVDKDGNVLLKGDDLLGSIAPEAEFVLLKLS